MSAKMSDPRVINASESAPDWSQWKDPQKGEQVVKMVLGPSPGNSDAKGIAANLPEGFAKLFPSLTHLYLWKVTDLQVLPRLPPGLQCLDVRGCAGLTTSSWLPERLETLVLEGSPHLAWGSEGQRASFPLLEELSVKGCLGIAQKWLHLVLQQSERLRKLDASECSKLTRIPKWAPNLVDIRLDHCTSLSTFPPWPKQLRRVSLRGTTSLHSVPNFPASLDYVDLAGTTTLRSLPDERGQPRTLFLFGSGITEPPASEQGKSADDNVAERTAFYFDEVSLTGPGEVKRCKLLVLGNGDAGKTSLALALLPGGDPEDAKRLGSTHGIQFWGWDLPSDIGGSTLPVQLHLWDFGGQEIYHNTHRLFMSKGSVFIVVWDPSQDGRQPNRSGSGYQDEWRPIQYWLDFIKMACPQRPRIALVCSKHSHKTSELEARWRGQVSSEFKNDLVCFYIDSLHKTGQLDKLEDWLAHEVGTLVHEQGTKVPSYWEVAQTMVQGWVQRMDTDRDFAAQYNQITPDQFRNQLGKAIRLAIANDKDGRCRALSDAIQSGRFELNEKRIERTLAFLTHSGWLYWDPGLFQGRVIVGQKWALDGLYTVLDRNPESQIYRTLKEKYGRFTVLQLGEWIWNKKYSNEEQELLRSFMETCGLCFRLRSAAEAWRRENIYVSFEHLPMAKEVGLVSRFESRSGGQVLPSTQLDIPRLHKHDWQRFLTDAGSRYGKDAEYASDAIYLRNREGEQLLILCRLNPGGLGGEINLRVHGTKGRERLTAAEEHLRLFVEPQTASGSSDVRHALGQASEVKEVFISYAREPLEKEGGTGMPRGYEEPVDRIEAYLSNVSVQPIRDNSTLKNGDDLGRFLEYAGLCPHVIVVHSDKYWRSPYTVYELWKVMDGLGLESGKSLFTVVIPVEHIDSGITREKTLNAYLDFWESYDDPPTVIPWQPAALRDHARSLLRNFSEKLSGKIGLNLKWADGEQKVLEEIGRRIGLPDVGAENKSGIE